MSTIEILLCLMGVGLCVVSFLLPDGKKEAGKIDEKLAEGVIKSLIEKEMSAAKVKLDGMVEETLSYGMEKTERSLEKVCNEKINAVSEYASTVIEDINKNHREVMFLYDMLNDKHQNLKETAVEVTQTAKEAEKTVQVLEDTAKKVETTLQGKGENESEPQNLDVIDFGKLQPVKERKVNSPKRQKKEKAEKAADVDIHFDGNGDKNSNEKILELHNMGKSNMAIAKELGLGVGEVKLVIDLYKGM